MSAPLPITPVDRPIDATVVVPGSKSITNRALLIAALADGASRLTGALDSDDTRFMAEALRWLGLPVAHDPDAATFTVQGGNGSFPERTADLFVGNSGTCMRFLVAALATAGGAYRVDGVPRMRERPIRTLIAALNDLGADVRSEAGNGNPPVVVGGRLGGGPVTMAGDQSSQYFSAVLMAAPYAVRDVEITVAGELVSRPYMRITQAVMEAFGVRPTLDTTHWRTLSVAAGQRYRGRDYAIEPDASGASYFFAAAAVTGGRVAVPGLGHHSTQGDLRFVEALRQMGADVVVGDDATTVTGPPDGRLHGVDVDFTQISDTAQTLAAIAPFAEGPTRITGVSHMRLKETDRVAALSTELRRLGQDVDELPDGLVIHPRPVRPATIETYDDHRMAMSFAITGLRAPGIAIADPDCISKTFPDFFERLARARREDPSQDR